jgi:glycosyltransferase involved in cell wall biosynthesis
MSIPPHDNTAGPTISVVCCTHNREAFVRSHFAAIRVHLGEDIELVYALDNCTDATRAALEALADSHPKVRVLEHRGERGLFNCRNFGIAHARGNYIHFLDDDDSVEPGFYAQACAGLQPRSLGQPDIYLSRLRVSSEGENVSERDVMHPALVQRGVNRGHELHLTGDLFGPILQGRLYFNGANAVFSKALLQRYGYRSELKKSADWLFILEAALFQPLHVAYNPHIAANYYVHSSSMSIGPDKAIWNARVFELLLKMSLSRPVWAIEIRERCAKANFDAGFAQRKASPLKAIRHYIRAIRYGQYARGFLAVLKLPFARQG